jgi:PAS domain S-box-containing protein
VDKAKKLPQISDEMLRSVIDDIKISINVFDRSGNRIFVNPYYYHLSGKPIGSELSSDMITGENEEKGEHLTNKLMDAIKNDKTFEVHNFFYRSKGKKTSRYFDFIIGPLKNQEGKIIGGYTTVKDVTTRHLARRKLMRLNNSLEKKVKERTENLEKANEALKKISTEKNMIVSDIAHEIKTILTIIKGNIEMLELKKRATEPFEFECLEEIDKEMGKMSNIASDLVFIAKAKEYAQIFKMEKVDIVSLIKEEIKSHKIIIKNKFRVRLNNNINKKIWIKGDKAKIKTIISNIINNAIKFGKEKGNLTINIRQADSKVILEFKDDGLGIEKDKLDYIFNPFFQADKSRSFRERKFGRGFGLGLAICKKIVAAHEGKIWAQSEGLGKGATVTIQLSKFK